MIKRKQEKKIHRKRKTSTVAVSLPRGNIEASKHRQNNIEEQQLDSIFFLMFENTFVIESLANNQNENVYTVVV